jgi:hypothetical protein
MTWMPHTHGAGPHSLAAAPPSHEILNARPGPAAKTAKTRCRRHAPVARRGRNDAQQHGVSIGKALVAEGGVALRIIRIDLDRLPWAIAYLARSVVGLHFHAAGADARSHCRGTSRRTTIGPPVGEPGPQEPATAPPGAPQAPFAGAPRRPELCLPVGVCISQQATSIAPPRRLPSNLLHSSGSPALCRPSAMCAIC